MRPALQLILQEEHSTPGAHAEQPSCHSSSISMILGPCPVSSSSLSLSSSSSSPGFLPPPPGLVPGGRAALTHCGKFVHVGLSLVPQTGILSVGSNLSDPIDSHRPPERQMLEYAWKQQGFPSGSNNVVQSSLLRLEHSLPFPVSTLSHVASGRSDSLRLSAKADLQVNLHDSPCFLPLHLRGSSILSSPTEELSAEHVAISSLFPQMGASP
mmetsp:Transcript_9587/g.21030  ORF Transcript_9587/g.21030 Transcript_9587/m.21030 type:complete len:212 (+) Transcript_9587:3911-4546(+)